MEAQPQSEQRPELARTKKKERFDFARRKPSERRNRQAKIYLKNPGLSLHWSSCNAPGQFQTPFPLNPQYRKRCARSAGMGNQSLFCSWKNLILSCVRFDVFERNEAQNQKNNATVRPHGQWQQSAQLAGQVLRDEDMNILCFEPAIMASYLTFPTGIQIGFLWKILAHLLTFCSVLSGTTAV